MCSGRSLRRIGCTTGRTVSGRGTDALHRCAHRRTHGNHRGPLRCVGAFDRRFMRRRVARLCGRGGTVYRMGGLSGNRVASHVGRRLAIGRTTRSSNSTRWSPRRPYRLGEGPVSSGEIVRMVTVTADRYYDRRHEVRSRRCVVNDNGSLVPWSPAAPPSIRVLSSCPVREGSSGAPVLDREGRVRGLIHGGGPRYFAYGLMTLLPQPIQGDGG